MRGQETRAQLGGQLSLYSWLRNVLDLSASLVRRVGLRFNAEDAKHAEETRRKKIENEGILVAVVDRLLPSSASPASLRFSIVFLNHVFATGAWTVAIAA